MELSCYRQPKITAFELLLATLKCFECNFWSGYLPLVNQSVVGCCSGRFRYFQKQRTSELPSSITGSQGAEHGLRASPTPGAWSGADYISLTNSLQWHSQIKIAVTNTQLSNGAVDLTGLNWGSPSHQVLQAAYQPTELIGNQRNPSDFCREVRFDLISLAFCQRKNSPSEISNPFQWELKDNPRRSSAELLFASSFPTCGAILMPWGNGIICRAVLMSWEMKEVLTCNSREGTSLNQLTLVRKRSSNTMHMGAVFFLC